MFRYSNFLLEELSSVLWQKREIHPQGYSLHNKLPMDIIHNFSSDYHAALQKKRKATKYFAVRAEREREKKSWEETNLER